jgi:hypothetical protein
MLDVDGKYYPPTAALSASNDIIGYAAVEGFVGDGIF